jgi:hypothetical protein
MTLGGKLQSDTTSTVVIHMSRYLIFRDFGNETHESKC